MSPSNSSKTHSGDPATYQQMQEALFKFGNANETEAAIAAEAHIPTINTAPQVLQKSNVKDSGSAHDSTIRIEMPLDTETAAAAAAAATSNPLMLTQSQEQKNNQQSSERSSEVISPKSGPSQGFTDRSSLVLNLAKPIIPRPAVSGIETVGAVVSKSKNEPVPSGSATTAAAATSTSNAPAPKVTERISTNNSTAKGKGTARRRGKWTIEEEEYVARVIQDFNSGFLNAPAGYTLRSYLSDKLQCDPMRITKKFTGESCIGKRVFHPAVRSAANAAAIDKAQVRILPLRYIAYIV